MKFSTLCATPYPQLDKTAVARYCGVVYSADTLDPIQFTWISICEFKLNTLPYSIDEILFFCVACFYSFEIFISFLQIFKMKSS